jgi:hypothetical protein
MSKLQAEKPLLLQLLFFLMNSSRRRIRQNFGSPHKLEIHLTKKRKISKKKGRNNAS